MNNDDDRMCKHDEQIEFIKDILVLDLFHAGANWQNKFVLAQDQDGKVLPQKMDLLNAKRDATIEAYTDFFNIICESVAFSENGGFSDEESNDDVEDLLHKNIEN